MEKAKKVRWIYLPMLHVVPCHTFLAANEHEICIRMFSSVHINSRLWILEQSEYRPACINIAWKRAIENAFVKNGIFEQLCKVPVNSIVSLPCARKKNFENIKGNFCSSLILFWRWSVKICKRVTRTSAYKVVHRIDVETFLLRMKPNSMKYEQSFT